MRLANGRRRVEIEIDADTSQVQLVRRALDALLAGTEVGTAFTDLAKLLATEIVTNAVLHGGPPVRISLEHDHDTVRVRVQDGSHELPVRRAAVGSQGGRGLELVDRYAARWGAELDGAGKVVWFELSVESLVAQDELGELGPDEAE